MGPSSSGAPASHTGAPDEHTCATIGCHDDNDINSGTAILTIDAGTETYVANKTYEIRIRMTDPSVKRFGFQLVALSDQSAQSAGRIKISDPARTQILHNLHTLKDREYATYTFDGTEALEEGQTEWKIKWRAPAQASGPITFYVGGVSANDDETDKGDFVFTRTLTLNPLK